MVTPVDGARARRALDIVLSETAITLFDEYVYRVSFAYRSGEPDAKPEILSAEVWNASNTAAEEVPKKETPNRFGEINPEYYQTGGIQPIEYIEAKGFLPGMCAGNVIKYVSRYKNKNGIEDLKKAVWNLNCLLDYEIRQLKEKDEE